MDFMPEADFRVEGLFCEICDETIERGVPVLWDVDGEIIDGAQRTRIRVRCACHGEQSAAQGGLFA